MFVLHATLCIVYIRIVCIFETTAPVFFNELDYCHIRLELKQKWGRPHLKTVVLGKMVYKDPDTKRKGEGDDQKREMLLITPNIYQQNKLIVF